MRSAKNVVKLEINDAQKALKLPKGTKMLIRRCCNAVTFEEKFEKECIVDVTLVDNETIRAINNEQRNIDDVTDVLSFPLGEKGEYPVDHDTGRCLLGNIVLSVEKCQQQADEYGHDFKREIAYLTVHSMLHLFGYDHVNGGLEAVTMREKEDQILALVGYPRSNAYPDLFE